MYSWIVCHILLTYHISWAVKYSPLLTPPPLLPGLRHSDINYSHLPLSYDVTVLVYHDIVDPEEFPDNEDLLDSEDNEDSDPSDSGVHVTVQDFVDQMHYLAVNGYRTITVAQLYAYLTDNIMLPSRSVLLTFQEPWIGVWRYAYPILKQHGFHAAVFLSTDNVGVTETSTTTERHRMTWQQLKVMDNEPLFEIYPSGKSGEKLTEGTMTRIRLRRELQISRELLESKLGGTRTFFAWPHGAYDNKTVTYAQRYYNMSFTLDMTDDPKFDPLQEVPRFTVRRNYDIREFLNNLEIHQHDLSLNIKVKKLPNCFDVDLEVRGPTLREAINRNFVPCNDVLFYPSMRVTSKQVAALCLNIKRGIGLINDVTYEGEGSNTMSTAVTRAEVVIAMYHCAKYAWLEFANKLPQLEIVNPFSDVDGASFGGVIVAMAGFCDVAAPLNDRGDFFLGNDWSSRGDAAITAWRMLNCLRLHITPPGGYEDDFRQLPDLWQWSPEALASPGSVAVISSTAACHSAVFKSLFVTTLAVVHMSLDLV